MQPHYYLYSGCVGGARRSSLVRRFHHASVALRMGAGTQREDLHTEGTSTKVSGGTTLSSTHHDPSGKNSGLLLGSYWWPRKKNYWSLRFEPWTKLGIKECSTTKILLSGPQLNSHKRMCQFFCPAKQSADHSSNLPYTHPPSRK